MAVYAISDLHLPARQKPMDVFGPQWKDHFDRICLDWRERVTAEDLVLLPGDLSWAMHLEDALEDLAAVGELPGSKILLRGNHDYWWSSIGRVRRALGEGMYALQNDSLLIGERLYAGTRGWTLPGPETTAEDARIYERERLRLEMSLKHARDGIDALSAAHRRTVRLFGYPGGLRRSGLRIRPSARSGHLRRGPRAVRECPVSPGLL